MSEERRPEDKLSRWYFGGTASAITTCLTHPLDLIKVHLQTSQEKLSFLGVASHIVKDEGFLALWSGISAALLRQVTYVYSRFGIYEVGKQWYHPTTFLEMAALAAFAGGCGGLTGTPADKVNVRMQNDIKLPKEKRVNYKNAIDGLMRVYAEEGFVKLFTGATTAMTRAAVLSIGTMATYDKIKDMLLSTPYFIENEVTHFTTSILAGVIGATVTQPVDVLKTRAMNAKPGEFKNLWHIITHTAKVGPMGFYKGYIPACTRLVPQTILTFMIMEQFRLHFGFYPPDKKEKSK